MGLGGVAIAVLPSVVHLQLTFSDRLGGNDNQAQNIHIRMFFYGKKYHSIILRSLRTAKILQANE